MNEGWTGALSCPAETHCYHNAVLQAQYDAKIIAAEARIAALRAQSEERQVRRLTTGARLQAPTHCRASSFYTKLSFATSAALQSQLTQMSEYVAASQASAACTRVKTSSL